MSYAQCEFDATDEAGNLLSNVSVEVRRQPGLTLEPLYSDREGASNLANPFTATDGKVKFFAAGGAFRVVLTAGSYTRTRDYVAVGRAAETDLLLTSPKGAWSSGSTYSKGDLVSVAVGTLTRLFASVQNSNTNHTPDSTTPGDTSWWMYVGTVAGTASAPGITLTYDSTTVAADPGNGKFRLNNATHSSATALYADNVEALAGASITSLLDSWDDSTSTVKGRLTIAKASDPAVFRIYTVTGSVVDSSGYRTITISYVTGAGSLSNNDQCVFTFLATGDKGNIGGSTGSTDNALLRADGTGGATVQGSAVIVDDSGNISGIGSIKAGGNISSGEATRTLNLIDANAVARIWRWAALNAGVSPAVELVLGTGSTAADSANIWWDMFIDAVGGVASADRFLIRRRTGGAASNLFAVIGTGELQMSGNNIFSAARHLQLRSYTVSTLPSAATAGQMIYVSNESGGATPAFSDGTNWRRVADRTIVS